MCTCRSLNQHNSFRHFTVSKWVINSKLLSNSVYLLSKLRLIIVNALKFTKHFLLFHSVFFCKIVSIIWKLTACVAINFNCKCLADAVSYWFLVRLIYKVTKVSPISVYTLLSKELRPLERKLFSCSNWISNITYLMYTFRLKGHVY